MRKWISALFATACLVVPFSAYSCGEFMKTGEYRVALDTCWTVTGLDGEEKSVAGFASELIRSIALLEKRTLHIRSFNQDDLMYKLHQHVYESYLGPVSTERSLEKYFLVSDPVLSLEPNLNMCLVTCKDSGELINAFNHGLKILKSTGQFDVIAKKWGFL